MIEQLLFATFILSNVLSYIKGRRDGRAEHIEEDNTKVINRWMDSKQPYTMHRNIQQLPEVKAENDIERFKRLLQED